MTTMAGLGMPDQVGCGATVTGVAILWAAAAAKVGPGGWGNGASCSVAAALEEKTEAASGGA